MSIHAQDKANNASKAVKNYNEIKLNGLYLVLGALDLTYERTLNEESAFGATVFVPLDSTIDTDISFYFSPYYRKYFGKKYASGFFIEGFGLLSAYEKRSVFLQGIDLVKKEENNLAFALGLGVGGKWVTNSGFIGELGLGVGRNIINADDFADDLVAKINISVGYRF